MRFGVFDHLDASGQPLDQLYESRLRLAEAYDRAGMYAYHVAEHHATPLGLAPSPSLYLSAVAQRTKTLRFGPMVYLLPLYHPVRLIEEICMLDQLSRGRLQLGVGRGVAPREFAAYNVDFPDSGKVYHEAFQVIMKGLTSDELNFEGKYFQFKNTTMVVKPKQQPHPPLWYGLVFPDQATWPAANDVNIIMLGMRQGIRAVVDRYHEERKKAGKDPNKVPMIGVTRHVVVAETDEAALKIARRAYLKWVNSFYWIWDKFGDDPHIRHIYPATFDELMAVNNGIAGSPETVKKYIAAEAEATGLNYFVSWLAFGDLTVEESLRSLDLYTKQVMPAFADK
jgi:alkanesulfonate monooxygenase SsuD/methylene tetrahydromethanopterin reductase-like flavin-dependent oxidoreductase (luciferase family)